MFQWSDETLPHMLHSEKYADMVTHRELKERLYYDIIDYFDKGKVELVFHCSPWNCQRFRVGTQLQTNMS